jgi:tripartite-type tricarboxylate transporter receptor subunit TctC
MDLPMKNRVKQASPGACMALLDTHGARLLRWSAFCKRLFHSAIGVMSACFLMATLCHAQTFPSKPIRIVVPFGAGGVADLTARIVAQKMSESLGQQVVIDNRPGAGGVVAADLVAKSEPDGTTLFLISNGTAVSASLMHSLPFDPVNDFVNLGLLATFDLAILVNSDSKFNSLTEVIQYAKSHPGALNVGSINIGSTQNLTAELFKSTAGIDAQVIPFNGTPAVMTALKGGQVDVATEILGPVLPQIKAKNFKVLALTSEQRAASLPDTPTARELGVKSLIASSWNGLAAPAKTPKAIVERLNKEINLALQSPSVEKKLLELNINPKITTPAQAQEWYLSEIKVWARVIEKAGIAKQ